MSAPARTSKPENLLLNLICNVGLPTAILTWCSGERMLGPKWGLVVALIFPVAYGIYDFAQRRRVNFISIIGFVSVLITGGFGAACGSAARALAAKRKAATVDPPHSNCFAVRLVEVIPCAFPVLKSGFPYVAGAVSPARCGFP